MGMVVVRMKNRRSVSLRAKLLMASLSLVLFVVLLEIGLRFVGEEYYVPGSFFHMGKDADFQQVFELDSNRFWRFRTNSATESIEYPGLKYETDELGMRYGGGKDPHRASSKLIVALGNSCTFGWGVPFEETYVQQLEKILRRTRRCDVQVMNAGVPGYSSYQGKRFLEVDILRLRPDYVLLSFGWNDHWAAVNRTVDSEHQMLPQWLLAIQNTASNLKLYRFIRYMIAPARNDTTLAVAQVPGRRRVPPVEFYQNLVEMVELSRRHHATPILIALPIASEEEYFGGVTYGIHQLHYSYQDIVRKAAHSTGAALVDLQEEFDATPQLFGKDPVHFKASGHYIVARQLAALISPCVNK